MREWLYIVVWHNKLSRALNSYHDSQLNSSALLAKIIERNGQMGATVRIQEISIDLLSANSNQCFINAKFSVLN